MLCSGKRGLLSVSICRVRARRERPFAGMRQVAFAIYRRPASQRDSATASRLSPALGRVGDYSASPPSTLDRPRFTKALGGNPILRWHTHRKFPSVGAISEKRPSAETMLLSQRSEDGTMILLLDLVAACLGETWVGEAQ